MFKKQNIFSKTLVLLFLSFFLIVSCTTEKRLYLPGYYVEWHTKNKNKCKADTTKEESQSINTIKTKKTKQISTLEKTEDLLATTNEQQNVHLQKEEASPKIQQFKTKEIDSTKNAEKTIDKQQKKTKNKFNNKTKKHFGTTPYAAIIGFLMVIGGLILFFLEIYVLFSVVVFLVGFSLCCYSFYLFNNNPDLTGRFWAIFGFVLGITALIVLLIVLLMLILIILLMLAGI